MRQCTGLYQAQVESSKVSQEPQGIHFRLKEANVTRMTREMFVRCIAFPARKSLLPGSTLGRHLQPRAAAVSEVVGHPSAASLSWPV